MDKHIELALRVLEGAGPPGWYIASGIIGLTLALIVFARTAGLFDDARVNRSKTDFLTTVIAQYDKLTGAMERLQEDAERLEVENDALKDRQRELLTSIELLRAQVRRCIDLLTAVRDGRLPPSDIDARLAEIMS